MKSKTTKRALLSSCVALMLCFSMLLGTTYAWFTDSVTSSNNIIKSGTLDVEMHWADGTMAVPAVDEEWTDASKGAIFNYDLWEPGYTQVRHIKISNVGTLALKYQLMIQTTDEVSKLSDVIDVYYTDPAAAVADRTDLDEANKIGTLTEVLAGMATTAAGELEATQVDTVTIALKMQETAGNEYQNLSIGTDFSVILLATQLTSENDSFDMNYDKMAAYPGFGKSEVTDSASALEISVFNNANQKVGSAVVPVDAIDPSAEEIEVKITDSIYDANITVSAGEETAAFDVEVTGLVEGNTTPVKVTLKIPAGLDPATVKLYHYDSEIPCTYDPNTGYVKFESATFSPFTVVYDAESEYEAPDADEKDLPNAGVKESHEYVNVDLPWKSYGEWSPTEGLEAKLEAAYTFSCEESLEEAKANPYANWYCDFYVKLDMDLGANEIFLGGNYGSFGWVGFHNKDLTLEANTEIPLLGSVTNNPWTYLDVVQNVGEFICGVGDVDDALADATFTVMLRLTNPEDETESYDVATITHTFTKTVNSGEELQDAIENGNQNIELGGDIDLSNGLVIPGN